MPSPDDLSLDAIRDIPNPLGARGGPAGPVTMGGTPKPPALPVTMGETPKPPALPVPEATPPAERSLTREEHRARTRTAAFAAVVWVAAAIALFGVRADIASPRVAAPIAAWLVGGALAFGVVLRPRARGLPAGVRAVQHALWVVPAAYALTAVLIAQPAEGPLTWASIRGCLCLSTAMALGPLAAGALLLRGALLSAPGWRGAAVGAVLGLAGSIGVSAHCPVESLGHILLAHGAAIAIAAAAGGALGRLGGRP